MLHFVTFIFILFYGFSASGMEAEFDVDHHWEEMHWLAHSRTQWFKEKCQVLSDESGNAEERIKLVQKIATTIRLEDVPLRKGLSHDTQQKLRISKFVGAPLNDLTYSLMYWEFLERTIAYYSSAPNNTPEIRREVLIHFASEVKNFESFAVGDLKQEPQNSYFSKEFFYTQAILEECEILAQHYGILVETKSRGRDTQTLEDVEITTEHLERGMLQFEDDLERNSRKSRYFMEQLIIFRNDFVTSANTTIRPDLNHPKLRGFQAYVLPVTGPIFIPEVRPAKPIVVAEPKDVKKKQSKTTHKTGQGKKKANKGQVTPPKKQNNKEAKKRVDALNLKPTPQTVADSGFRPEDRDREVGLSSMPTSAEPKPTTPKMPKAPGPSIADEAVEKKSAAVVFQAPQQVILLPRIEARFAPVQRLNLKDIRPHIEHRVSTSYTYGGEIFPIGLFDKPKKCFESSFLDRIKELTYRFSDRSYPNIAQTSLIVHLQVEDNPVRKVVPLQELFLSGGKSFDYDSEFKRANNIVTACPDLLSQQEISKIKVQPQGQKSAFVGLCMEKKLREKIAAGYWGNNCTDSEAVFALWFLKKLPDILQGIVLDTGSKSVRLDAMVIGISSLRDGCPDCQNLTQCLQANLRSILLGIQTPNLRVSESFASLAIISGKIRGKPFQKEQPLKGNASLEPGQHKLVCTQTK